MWRKNTSFLLPDCLLLKEDAWEERKCQKNKAICMAKRCSDKQGGGGVVAQRTGRLLSSAEESAIPSCLWRNRRVSAPLRARNVARHSNALCEYQIKIVIQSESREEAEMRKKMRREEI